MTIFVKGLSNMKIPGVMLMQKYETATHKVVILGDVETGGKILCIAHFTDKVPLDLSVKKEAANRALDVIRDEIKKIADQHDQVSF